MLADDIKAEALRLGFDLAGIAPAVPPGTYPAFREWLDRGFAGEMGYLSRRAEAYADPDLVMEGVKSIVLLATNYRTAEPVPAVGMQALVSRYAWGDVDYHDLHRERLKQLAAFVKSRRPGCRTRGIVDTAPLLERDFARLAGLGWFGKNTLLINKRLGSWLFLSALLVDIELEYDAAHTASHCGTCTRCLDACPTDAFVGPYVLDARKCISYLTIELREAIPLELREGMGQWLFGCDVCQDVCPWNRKAPQTAEPHFQPRPDLAPADAVALLGLSEAEFEARFRGTPLARPKRAGLLRNAAIVLGNSGDPAAVPALCAALGDAEPLVRGAAAWALGRLGGQAALAALSSRLAIEADDDVRAEIQHALALLAGLQNLAATR
jgi:epoxyqueuosine reductase